MTVDEALYLLHLQKYKFGWTCCFGIIVYLFGVYIDSVYQFDPERGQGMGSENSVESYSYVPMLRTGYNWPTPETRTSQFKWMV